MFTLNGENNEELKVISDQVRVLLLSELQKVEGRKEGKFKKTKLFKNLKLKENFNFSKLFGFYDFAQMIVDL